MPWITSAGQRTRAASASSVGRSSIPVVVTVRISVSGSVSCAHPAQSSICLVECGSVKHWGKKNSTNPS